MASRRRQAADKSQRTCEEEEKRKEPGSSNRENPGRSKKLSRGRKSGAACLSSPASTPVPCRSEKEEENCANKKTPQMLSKYKPWDINSPSRDAEQHHEIFWDPNSPTCFKLDGGKRKTSSKCTVEISDIVNRIAPKDGKPSNSDASYFGVWIGDDAIPCTPVVTRTRAKLHRSKILKTEEKLMELAKQLDRNLVEHKDQNEDGMIVKAHRGVNVQEDDGSFLEYIPEEDELSASLKSASQRSGIKAQESSQRPVDQEAEEALNALFDCSTQKYSGRLSQTLSHVSTSSTQEFVSNPGNGTEQNQLLTKDKAPSESKSSDNSSLVSKVQLDILECANKSKQAVSSINEPVEIFDNDHSASNSQDDFEDDWGDDILEDESFVMQITKNPELITPPKSKLTSRKESNSCKSKVITPNRPNNFKFVARKLNEGEGSKMKPPDLNTIETAHVKRVEGSTRDRTTSSLQPLGLSGAQDTKQDTTGQKSSRNPSSNIEASKTYTFSSKPLNSRKEKDELAKKGVQALKQTQAASKSKESVFADEWNDPKFSDEVLDMFCESDSLWEEKDDDDDLLYQVCDDVERLTQAQTYEVNTQDASSKHNNDKKSVSNNKSETHITTNRSCASNKSSECSNKIGAKCFSPAPVSGNCSNSFQNNSFQRTNQTSVTFSRSNSMPSVAETKKVNEAPSQNVNNLQPTATNVKTSHAPSKYSFTRTKPSAVLSVHTNGSISGNERTSKGFEGYIDTNKRNPHIQPYAITSQQSSLKRHLSESTIHSLKDSSKKCSMEEIERKKQEALARRKMRERVCSSDTAPT